MRWEDSPHSPHPTNWIMQSTGDTHPSHPHTRTFRNSERKCAQDEMQNQLLAIVRGISPLSFLISLVFSRVFGLSALTASFQVCFSVSLSQSHTTEAHTECKCVHPRIYTRLQRRLLAPTEAWGSGVVIKRDVAVERDLNHSLMTDRVLLALSSLPWHYKPATGL